MQSLTQHTLTLSHIHVQTHTTHTHSLSHTYTYKLSHTTHSHIHVETHTTQTHSFSHTYKLSHNTHTHTHLTFHCHPCACGHLLPLPALHDCQVCFVCKYCYFKCNVRPNEKVQWQVNGFFFYLIFSLWIVSVELIRRRE